MTEGREVLTLDAADRTIRDTLRGSDQVRIGAEAEWLVFDAARPSRPVLATETAEVAGDVDLPAGGTVSVEPGGQLELSTHAFTSPEALRAAIEEDTGALARRFRRMGLVLVPLGLDPLRSPVPSLDAPRYVAMERHFRQESPQGVRMMASTAALQLSVDPGSAPLRCWRVLSAAAPLLSAVFANSGPPGSASARQRIWASTDPSRTTPVSTDDPQAWVDAVLDAWVMLRAGDGDVAPVACRRSFRTWLDDERDPPTAADLAVHLTTMFPPIRPRGHLEVPGHRRRARAGAGCCGGCGLGAGHRGPDRCRGDPHRGRKPRPLASVVDRRDLGSASRSGRALAARSGCGRARGAGAGAGPSMSRLDSSAVLGDASLTGIRGRARRVPLTAWSPEGHRGVGSDGSSLPASRTPAADYC